MSLLSMLTNERYSKTGARPNRVYRGGLGRPKPHGMARIRLRRLVKVCLTVACKVIACNIKRWARTPTVPEWLLYGITTILAYIRQTGAVMISGTCSPLLRRWSMEPEV